MRRDELRAASVLEAHHARIRSLLGRFRGKEVDTAGDGFLATFDGPIRAVRCALVTTQAVKDIGLEIRAGLHTGADLGREGAARVPRRGRHVHPQGRDAARPGGAGAAAPEGRLAVPLPDRVAGRRRWESSQPPCRSSCGPCASGVDCAGAISPSLGVLAVYGEIRPPESACPVEMKGGDFPRSLIIQFIPRRRTGSRIEG